jgi:hypothetical protein
MFSSSAASATVLLLRLRPSPRSVASLSLCPPHSSPANSTRIVRHVRYPNQQLLLFHPHPHRCHLLQPRRRSFVSSPILKQQQQQRLTLRPVSPRVRNNNVVNSAARSGRGRGNWDGGGKGGGRYPTYVYVTGGLVVASSVGVYLNYQNYAPLTHRRRWIATTPELEKVMGDEVRVPVSTFLGMMLRRTPIALLVMGREVLAQYLSCNPSLSSFLRPAMSFSQTQ